VSDAVLLDDHLLLAVLLGREPAALRPDSARIATTGLWYHRLCRALIDSTVVGSMSRRLSGLAPATASAAIASVVTLPGDIEMVSLRTLGWPMAELLSGGLRLNLLSLEAIAAARAIDAEICLAAADRNEALIGAARELGLNVRTVEA
jgi:hypothetical protein